MTDTTSRRPYRIVDGRWRLTAVSDGCQIPQPCEGTAFNDRNVAQRGLARAADRAGLNPNGQPRLTLHDLRHTFGSHPVRQGTDVVTVCRQMGHAGPSIIPRRVLA